MMKTRLLSIFVFLFCFFPLYGTDIQRGPIGINLIIDGSAEFAKVKDEAAVWLLNHIEDILAVGDTITIWNAGTRANVIFSGRIDSPSDKETVKNTIRGISASGNNADFSNALLQATQRQGAGGSGFSYTLLVSSSPAALASTLSGPHANLLRFSRVQDFSGWRALVIGLNLDSTVRNAAMTYLNQ